MWVAANWQLDYFFAFGTIFAILAIVDMQVGRSWLCQGY